MSAQSRWYSMQRFSWLMLIVTSFFSFHVNAGPDISIGTMYDYLGPERSTLLKRIRNLGDASAFVSVSLAEIHFDKEGRASEVALEGSAGEQRALIVTPTRLILAAGGTQSARLIFRGDREQERYFRLRFTPVMPGRGNDFGLDDRAVEAYRAKLDAQLSVLAGYGTVLLVSPKSPRFQTSILDTSRQITVGNRGNATVVLEELRDCAPDGSECSAPATVHVRPGSTFEIKRLPGRVHRFERVEGGKRKAFEYGA